MTELPTIEIDPEEMARIVWKTAQNLLAPGPSDPGFTAAEYAKTNGIGVSTARRHIRKLRQQGVLVRGKRWMRREMDGHWQRFPVYRPKEKTE